MIIQDLTEKKMFECEECDSFAEYVFLTHSGSVYVCSNCLRLFLVQFISFIKNENKNEKLWIPDSIKDMLPE